MEKGCLDIIQPWARGSAWPGSRDAERVQVSLTIGSTMAAAADEADMNFWKGAGEPPFPRNLHAYRVMTITCLFTFAIPKLHAPVSHRVLIHT